jgi:putative membrane protein
MQIFINIAAVFLRIMTNSLSNVFQKKLAFDGEKPVCINFINYLLLSVACLPFLFITDLSKLSGEFWFYALLGGITGALCNNFMVIALKYGELSVLGPINSYKAVIGLIFGMILLHEIPNIYGIIGVILIIFGTYFIFDNFTPSVFIRKDIKYRFLALFFSALEAVLIKKVILLSSVSTSVIASSILGAVFSYIIIKINGVSKVKFPDKKHSIMYILTALCFGLMTITTAYVFKHINVGYALSLFQLSIIVNVILGYKLFKEKNLIKKLIGSLIILIGSATILIYGH